MNENITTSELIDRLVMQSGIKKKLATELLRAIPEIIEEGLKNDGEVRVKDFGTFRMKWTQGRTGRNPKTGETVEIPSHNRLVFLPEQMFKEFVNQDNRLLSYKVIPHAEELGGQRSAVSGQEEEEVVGRQSSVVSEEEEVGSQQSAVGSNPESEEEIDYSYEPEPEQPVRRRRSVHWIVPVAITVIAVLCVVFYFRNFNPIFKKSEDRRQKAYIVTKEDSSQKSEDSVGGQQSAVSGQLSADTVQSEDTIVQSSKVKGQSVDSVAKTPEPENKNLESEIPHQKPRNPETQEPRNPGTQEQKIVNSEGKHLFQIAREVYGNPFLWVLIYKENIDKIPAPDVVIAGKELVIPALEGKPRKLTHNDSLNVADGYRMVYEYYLDKGDPKAEEFHKTYQNYLPK